MSEYVISQLHFITNTEQVLGYIKAGRVHDSPPPEFSLNAIRSMPDALFLPLEPPVLFLSAWNVDLSSLNDTVREEALSAGMTGRPEKINGEEMAEKIESAERTSRDTADARLIERAVSNYRQFGYFSPYDWRFANWGTVADIHSVVPDTFRVPTSCLEFTTRWTPPVAAMQELANTFPSVRFKLKYRYDPEGPWMVADLFAFPPFGY
jgi:hypothetical protein